MDTLWLQLSQSTGSVLPPGSKCIIKPGIHIHTHFFIDRNHVRDIFPDCTGNRSTKCVPKVQIIYTHTFFLVIELMSETHFQIVLETGP